MTSSSRRATFIPATAFRLRNKGRLSVGSDADLVLFDPAKISETAGFPGIGDPDSPPRGIPHVIVAGVPVILDGKRIAGLIEGKTIRF